MKAEDFGSKFASDVKSLQDMRTTVKSNPREGLKAAAQQFEALFMQMMLKSMRDATPQDGMFDSSQTRFYTSMFDEQLAQNLSGKGALGFAKLIEMQLGKSLPDATALPDLMNGPPEPPVRGPSSAALPAWSKFPGARPPYASPPSPPPLAAPTASAAVAAPVSEAEIAGPRDFVARVWPHAQQASLETGIPPQFLVAHAALESGWGKSEIRRADGSSSHNLFGVKAGRRWAGATVDAMTTEYVNGVAEMSREKFRAYGSYLDAFRDYAALLKNNSRFSQVLGQTDGTEFARQLQRAGYATDPMYADKLSRIISGPTLRHALIG
jgi:flagellar protein FlgJ